MFFCLRIDLPDDNQRSADLSDGQFNADDLLDDFLEFLKLKGNVVNVIISWNRMTLCFIKI